MSVNALRKHVETRLSTQLAITNPTVKIKYENVKFNQPSNQTYVSIYLLEGDSFQASLGTSFTERHVGVLQVDIMTPEGTGTQSRNALAETIGGFFRRNQALLEDGSYVQFRVPRYTSLGNEGLFDRIAVSIPYYRDEKYTQ